MKLCLRVGVIWTHTLSFMRSVYQQLMWLIISTRLTWRGSSSWFRNCSSERVSVTLSVDSDRAPDAGAAGWGTLRWSSSHVVGLRCSASPDPFRSFRKSWALDRSKCAFRSCEMFSWSRTRARCWLFYPHPQYTHIQETLDFW